MKRNVTIAGAKYTGVPSIMIPLTDETGSATFCEVSDTTATAADVATGKTFYNAAGTLTTGTATGGSGTADPGFTVNLTQTEGQTINYTSLDSKIIATAGTMSIKPGSFTANFDIVPDKGYDAGNLNVISHTFQNWGETLTVTADPAVKSVENKFTFNKKNNEAYTPITLTIHGTEYTFKYDSSSHYSFMRGLFNYRKLDFDMEENPEELFNPGHVINSYFCLHGLKITDSNNNWVILTPPEKKEEVFVDDMWAGYYKRRTITYETGSSSGKNTSNKDKSAYTMFNDFKSRYNNGETFTFEFVDTWDK